MPLIIVLFSFITSFAFGGDLPESCIQCLAEESKLDSLTKITLPFRRLQFLEKKAQNLESSHNLLVKNLAPLARTLRDGKSEPTYAESRIEINAIKKDFDRLTLIQKESLILEKQFNICVTNCSAYRRSVLEQDIKNIQRLKTSLIVKRPILSNKVFEDRLSKLDDKFIESDALISNEIFESDLKDAVFDSLQNIQEKMSEYHKFLNDPNKPLIRPGNESFTQKYLDKVSSRFPELIQDTLRTSNDDSLSCYFADQMNKYSDQKRKQEIAVDVGLFILPMMAGPFGLEASMLARLGGWGLKANEARKVVVGTSMMFEAALVAKDRIQLQSLENSCRKTESNLFLNPSIGALKEVEDCREKYGEELFLSNLSIIPGGLNALRGLTTPIKLPVHSMNAASTQDISSSLFKNGIGDKAVLEFQTPKNGVFSVLDVGDLKQTRDASIQKIPEQYWRYVGNIYNERLNLTPKEIESFIQSSMEMGPRTKLIINTERSAVKGDSKFKGGVGIVTSSNSKELLPFEKATGVKIDKKPGEKVAEIVRLTVGKDGDAVELSQSLVYQAVNLIRNDKEITKTYIYTSKIHGRLYRRMGVPSEKIKTLNDRDVMIEISRDDLENIAKAKIGY